MVVSTDDADKPLHCENNNCGLLYPNIIQRAVQASGITKSGILAIGGVNGVSGLVNCWASAIHHVFVVNLNYSDLNLLLEQCFA